MTEPGPATLTRLPDDRAEIRFERELRHPPEAVWRALTDADELAHWFPARVEGAFVPGGALRFVFPEGEMEPTTGEVLEAAGPRVLVFRWGTDVLRFDLSSADGGCRLVFTHTVDAGDPDGGPTVAARTAAGWDGCLLRLRCRLDGRPAPPATDGWSERNEAYLARFAQ